jgi:hypothetical protein
LKKQKILQKTLAFFKNLCYYIKARSKEAQETIYHADRRCSEWLSVIFVARA